MKTIFGAITQQHITKILSKTNTRVLTLFMFYDTRQKKLKKCLNLLSYVIYTIIKKLCLYCLFSF